MKKYSAKDGRECEMIADLLLSDKCKWKAEVDTGVYDTSCDNSFMIIEGTPTDNNMKYCTYCGRKIKEVKE